MLTPLSLRRIVAVWWPLAASWLLMAAELPALSAVIARLAEPEAHLAAYGGIVFPLALIFESPIIMLLAASTALSKDWASYRLGYRFMMITSAILTAIHVLVAFTPLYDIVARELLGAPEATLEPGRIGLMLMTPWTWSIAYRRFHQGVLIRFGRSQAVSVGTVIRLGADLLVLAAGYAIHTLPGIAVATAAVAAGVICEAVFIGLIVRPVLKGGLREAPPVEPPLTLRAFFAFYIPLALTSLIMLLANPLGSASLSRMPQALASLAAWAPLTGLIFIFRSMGIAYNEVVVALLDEPEAAHQLRRFTTLLALATTGLLLLMAATPLSMVWFGNLSALRPDLAELAKIGLWFALPLPALSVMQSWYQGAILHGRRTGGLTESVIIYLIVYAILAGAGVAWGQTTGLYVGLGVLTLATLAQTVWLWVRSRGVMRQIDDKTIEGL